MSIEIERSGTQEVALDLQENQKNGLEKLTRLLRGIGACVLITSGLVYLLQEWHSLSHMTRYICFLLFTVVTAGTGLFCGSKLKDFKSARVLLMVVAATISIHFTQVGAFLYSAFGHALSYYPALLYYKAASPQAALLLLLTALPALVCLTLLAFRVLIRPIFVNYSMLYLGLNAVLLIPSRDPLFAAIAGMLGVIVIATFELRLLRNFSVATTFEGKMVRLMLLAPVGIIFVRTMSLYSVTASLLAALFFAVSILLYVLVPQMFRSEGLGNVSRVSSAFTLGLAFLCAMHAIDKVFMIPIVFEVPFVVLPLSAAYVFMGLQHKGTQKVFMGLASVVATIPLLIQMNHFDSVFTSSLGLLVSIVVLVSGYMGKSLFNFLVGAFAFGLTILYHLEFAFELYTYSLWVSLGVTGLFSVVVAALLERYHQKLELGLRNLRARFQ
ncbi:MAG: hypothetical protein KDD62_04460 [Bdellovibrionales bacterium]|nr:hypothetical protein [Bdellovibrionales bacterium]